MQVPSPRPPGAALLAFDGIMVVVGGGSFDPALLARLAARGAALVGADGGGDAIAAAGLEPDAIIGDLDSLREPERWAARTRLIRIPEQITTDFQKVLYSTSARVTVALGMTGKRFDHTLAALSAVTEFGRERTVILVDEHDIALAVSGRFGFTVAPGERVSVHPLLPVGFRSSRGLLYPLDGLHLASGGLLGTSNQAVEGPFEIVPEDDTPWLLILDRTYLLPLIDTLEAGA